MPLLDDRQATDRQATDRQATAWQATKRMATNRMATDLAATDLATTDLAATDLAATDLAATDLAATNLPAWQRRFSLRNEQRLRPMLPPPVTDLERAGTLGQELDAEVADRLAEEDFVTTERRSIAPLLLNVPSQPAAFLEWFEGLRQTGPGQDDPLFPWLAADASYSEMMWFLGQELAGEAGFEDLLALTQIKMPTTVKLEMARNFWDELGRGRQAGMHGPMLESLAAGLSVRLPVDQIVWESLALSNLMVALAWNRRYAFQAIGALGVIELTAPGRSAQVNAGLRRLGVPPAIRRYFALHATLDVRHSLDWNREVLLPLAASDANIAGAIAEGALLRLNAGARCFQRYRSHFHAQRMVGASDDQSSQPSS